MNPNMLCSKCKKRMAVVFVTRMEGDKPINEGLCIKCAKEMNIKPVTDLLDKMGITDEQLDAMDDQMAGLIDSFGDSFDMGGAAVDAVHADVQYAGSTGGARRMSRSWMATMPAASWKAMSRKKQTAYSRRTDAPQRKSVSRKRNAKSTSSCPLTVKT